MYEISARNLASTVDLKRHVTRNMIKQQHQSTQVLGGGPNFQKEKKIAKE